MGYLHLIIYLYTFCNIFWFILSYLQGDKHKIIHINVIKQLALQM
jgi:hypothetical protein